MSASYPFRLCIVRDYDKSLAKPWHVEYYIWDMTAQKKRRMRVVLNQPTARQRYAYAREVIADIDPLLKSGHVINPVRQSHQQAELSHTSTLVDAVQKYLDIKKRSLRPNSFSTYNTDCQRLLQYLRHKKINPKVDHFTTDHATDFGDYLILKLKISNRSRNNTVKALSTFFNYLVNRKHITSNPFAGVELLPVDSRKHTAFTPTQADTVKKAILSAEDHQLYIFINFIYYCFLRPRTELLTLTVGDIQDGKIKVKAQHAKNRKTQYVKIPRPLIAIIEQYQLLSHPEHYYLFSTGQQPGIKPLFENSLYQRHKAILHRCMLQHQHLDTYSWKHTGAIALWNATKDIELIRRHCRHSDIATTFNYLRDLGIFTEESRLDQFPEL